MGHVGAMQEDVGLSLRGSDQEHIQTGWIFFNGHQLRDFKAAESWEVCGHKRLLFKIPEPELQANCPR
jgi:hypothetical protein